MTEPSATFLLFGATGDLARRMIFPSLYNLLSDGLLPDDFLIVASGRSEMDDAAFRKEVDDALRQFLAADRYDADVAARFGAMIGYQPVDAGNADQFAKLAQRIDGRLERGLSVYLSTPPSLFAPTAQGLADAGLITPHTRIAMEKPIGKDLASSKVVNDGIGALFAESQIFRVDHYLGKETVQNLLALRFGNVMFEPLWNTTAIDHVQITVGETVGLEGRVSYYDGVGALRDMVQNHILQILSIIAMEPPARMDPTAVRDEKVKVLRSLRPMTDETVKTHSVRGQYTPGAVSGQIVTGYADELGQPSDTETFVALKAYIDNWRWQGVPFYLRTGKRMPARQSEIVIQFKPVRHSIFGRDGHGTGLEPNTLVIRLQPEEYIRLAIMSKRPGLERQVKLDEVTLDVSLTAAFAGQRRRIAYERLILDLLAGDQTLFVRRDEVEAQWTWIDSIIDGWKEANVKPAAYSSGNWGPSSAIALIERDGASWHD
ncbi:MULTISPECIES: glucose-6-phosphate dehydrogenase [Sphingobium]|uniref:Glucose-6-phosphate 1-dehydrogenase n=1 Tax=Sphingobium limneticum TaxID=1007511 RepID=A0A5J5I8N1_9SPHN|nr:MULTISPECIES: glucose-6-phosphate dehydrogenase [Sphingobium]MBU0931301.1 glucose-6-phosphate dehydrogenase [Alphaproteobacteria bacterium]KAA9013636.1 glucose-6-phosphate dehydrogenase [Sphingobium limneticum]KAA9020805.1 glucose-6-phosphate dehydrogenase [Sphingobium limneticum]KAA9033132.1 glucose-6-phosphate dehydrogenase [Sphingobium limneticum]BBC99161.1 glucose-6-phosphate 1-dehydrogenase [Sphingobium sp. YG1]